MRNARSESLVGNPGSAYRALPPGAARITGAGFTLLELVITITILSILTLGAVPLVKISVKRQREQELRATLRELRMAIDQFHREAVLAPQTQVAGTDGRAVPTSIDPRVRVYVSDQTIFTVDNSDRYPPSLEMLVDGVDVLPLASSVTGAGDPRVNATEVGKQQLTPKKKVYLRAIPIDPLTGKAEWDLRSCYQAVTDTSWDNINVFDVRSKATGTALNGERYSDW